MSTWELREGDCLDVLRTLESESVDSCVCDPPYGLSGATPSDVKKALRAWLDGEVYNPSGVGFMGKSWDAFVPGPEVWGEVFRVLKPGGFLLVFAGTRTQDLMGLAIRIAGFECRDAIRIEGCLSWCYGSGFPKSRNIGKDFDGDERPIVGEQEAPGFARAKTWDGWGTALKPSWEPVLIFRKPPVGTIAENVLAYGTGAINIDGCRVETSDNLNGGAYAENPTDRYDGTENWRYKRGGGRSKVPGDERTPSAAGMYAEGSQAKGGFVQPSGRWPSNLVLVHTPDCDACRVGFASDADKGSAKPQGISTSRKAAGDGGLGAGYRKTDRAEFVAEQSSLGRWPANVVLSHSAECVQSGEKTVPAPVINRFTDGMKPFGGGAGHPYESSGGGTETIPVWECAPGCPVAALDAQSGELTTNAGSIRPDHAAMGYSGNDRGVNREVVANSGGASRFFPQFSYTEDDAPFMYCTKASRAERNEGLEGNNNHPTVKPIALLQWLQRLVTPPGGLVLDNFAGSGSGGVAAIREGFRYLGIEREPEYVEIARGRIAYAELKSRGGVKNPWTAPAPEEKPGEATTLDDLFGFGEDP